MKLQLTRPLVSFDLETTGTDTATARIVEMAFFKLCPDDGKNKPVHDGVRDTLRYLVNPEVSIPADSMAVHGITDEMVANSPIFKMLAPEVLAFLEGCDLLGFNCLAYDVPVLWQEFQRAGIDWDHLAHHVIDAGNIYKLVAPRTLIAAVQQYCFRDHAGAHSAFHDAEATAEVLLQQVERHAELPVSVEALAIHSNHGRKRADVSGKFTVNEAGEYVLNFGQNRGQLARDNRSFLSWMLSKEFPKDAQAICREILYGPKETIQTIDIDEDLPI